MKKVKKGTGKVTYCNILCLCSFHKCIEKGKCFKPAYRADVAGKGLDLLLKHKDDNEKKLGLIMSFPDWNTNIDTRKQVRHIRQQNKLYRKAVKSMKVEIAVRMMSTMYESLEKAHTTALPCEVCICAVFFTSYHNIKQYINSNYRIRRQLEQVIAMDQVWYALVTRYQYALNGNDRHLLISCERQLKIFLQRDRNVRQLKIQQNQANERLKKSLAFANDRLKKSLAFAKNLAHKGMGGSAGNGNGNGKNLASKSNVQGTSLPILPSSRMIYEGVLGREELYRHLLSMQSEQMALNSRISAYNIDKLAWKHEDWSAAATAANAMNVLHKGWTSRKTGRSKRNGKIEYMYYNRKLNAKLNQKIANGISKKKLPTFMKKTGITCPQSNLWTARNIFETFLQILRLRLPKFRIDQTYLKDYRVVLPHVQNILKKEYQWAGADRDLHDKLYTYISKSNVEIQESFQNVRQQMNEVSMEDNGDGFVDVFEIIMGSSDDDESDDD